MPALKSSTDVFHAISDTNRRRILDLLANQPRPVSDCVSELGITYSAVSQHLKVLLAVGLVTRRKQGKQRLYRSQFTPLQEVHSWTATYRYFWTNRLESLEDYLDQKKEENEKP